MSLNDFSSAHIWSTAPEKAINDIDTLFGGKVGLGGAIVSKEITARRTKRYIRIEVTSL